MRFIYKQRDADTEMSIQLEIVLNFLDNFVIVFNFYFCLISCCSLNTFSIHLSLHEKQITVAKDVSKFTEKSEFSSTRY